MPPSPAAGGVRGRVVVADYVSRPAAAAAHAIRRAGLRPGLERCLGHGREATGLVVAQNPAAGGELARNGILTLYIAARDPRDGDPAASQPGAPGALVGQQPPHEKRAAIQPRRRRRKRRDGNAGWTKPDLSPLERVPDPAVSPLSSVAPPGVDEAGLRTQSRERLERGESRRSDEMPGRRAARDANGDETVERPSAPGFRHSATPRGHRRARLPRLVLGRSRRSSAPLPGGRRLVRAAGFSVGGLVLFGVASALHATPRRLPVAPTRGAALRTGLDLPMVRVGPPGEPAHGKRARSAARRPARRLGPVPVRISSTRAPVLAAPATASQPVGAEAEMTFERTGAQP